MIAVVMYGCLNPGLQRDHTIIDIENTAFMDSQETTMGIDIYFCMTTGDATNCNGASFQSMLPWGGAQKGSTDSNIVAH